MLVCVYELTHQLLSGQGALEDDFGVRDSAFKYFFSVSPNAQMFSQPWLVDRDPQKSLGMRYLIKT